MSENAQLGDYAQLPDWSLALVTGVLVALACAFAADAREALGVSVLLGGLAYLALVDWRTLLIPVWPVVALIVAGFVFRSTQGEFLESLSGSAIAGGFFWGLSVAYEAVRGRAGLGSGDALVAASLGAWLPASSVAWSIALAGLLTLAAVFGMQALGWRKSDVPAPFAPGLAVGAYIAIFLWGL